MSDMSQGPGWFQASDGKWYAPQPPSQPASKKKFYKKVWFWLLVFVVVVFGGCGIVIGSTANSLNKALNEKVSVVYSITGSGTADINYDTITNGNVGSSQITGSAIPWTKTVAGTGAFSIFTLSGTLTEGSTISCAISINGKVVSTNTSSGQYATVSCSGTPPTN